MKGAQIGCPCNLKWPNKDLAKCKRFGNNIHPLNLKLPNGCEWYDNCYMFFYWIDCQDDGIELVLFYLVIPNVFVKLFKQTTYIYNINTAEGWVKLFAFLIFWVILWCIELIEWKGWIVASSFQMQFSYGWISRELFDLF